MIKARNRLAVKNNKLVSSRVHEGSGTRLAVTANNINTETAAFQETANFTLSGMSKNSISVSAIGTGTTRNLDLLLSGFIDERNEFSLRTLYRDIYYYDVICGGAADMTSTLPFSDFSLVGLDGKKINTFMDSVDRLNLKTSFPEFSLGYLVDGLYLGTLVYSPQMKIFTDILPHDPQDCTLEDLPFNSQDHLVKVRQSENLKRFLTSDEPVIRRLRQNYSPKLLSELNTSEFTLDPLTTIFLPRRGLNGKINSYFRRVLPWYLLEKMLLRGTLVEVSKRQRSALHAACLSGNTLISTKNGLQRIDEIVNHSTDDAPFSVPIDLKVKGYDNEFHTATRWHYRGIKKTVIVKTTSGREIVCTPDHKIQILGKCGNLLWKEAESLVGEMICVSMVPHSTEGAKNCTPLNIEEYKYFDNYGYKFERVVSVKSGDFRPVYDLSMEKGCRNAFVANSIVVHNCGDDTWEPTPEELQAIVNLFQQADFDPLGPVIATRNGVQLSEIRQGGDFFKITDIIDTTNQLKLRALGISEDFLSGAATYACLTGDTLIATEFGLVPIRDLATGNEEKQDIDVVVSSRYKPEKAVKWLYSGYVKTLKVTTDMGNEIKCTDIHPLLVLKGFDTVWVDAKDIRIGDKVCIPTENLVDNSKTKLELHLPDPVTLKGRRTEVLKPSVMTPDLAYLMGCIISEGQIDNCERIIFSNTDTRFLDVYENKVEKVFGLKTIQHINSVTTNLVCYNIHFNSRTVVEWFDKLGLYCGGTVDGLSESHHKVIPWSILQADSESQFAFLAAYLEGDGCVRDREIVYVSASNSMLNQIQALLNYHGIVCRIYKQKKEGGASSRVVVKGVFADLLWSKIKPYMVTKKLPDACCIKARTAFGFSVDAVKTFIETRQIKFNRHGTFFIDDNGKEVCIRGWKNICNFNKSFLYDQYDRGEYDKFLSDLALFAPKESAKLKHLLDLKYYYTEVVSVKNNGKQHVYDISMEKGKEPAFVANGLIVHNTAETALSVYIENMKSYRDFLTQQIFYKKMFPLIAHVNGFIKKSSPSNNGTEQANSLSFKINDSTRYDIPQVRWHKSLQPHNDRDTMDILNQLSEKGIPVTLRMWAAAGGVNIDNIIQELDEDKATRLKIAEVVGVSNANGEGGGDGGDEFASLRDIANPLKPVGWLNRDYGDTSEVYTHDHSGKKKHVFNQTAAIKKQNENIVKALSEMSDPSHYASVRDRTIKRLKVKPRT